jgi:hypothetical protein
MNINEDDIDELLEQFCYYNSHYAEWRWKIESLYELTEEELNILHQRAHQNSSYIRIDQSIMYHIVKKVFRNSG